MSSQYCQQSVSLHDALGHELIAQFYGYLTFLPSSFSLSSFYVCKQRIRPTCLFVSITHTISNVHRYNRMLQLLRRPNIQENNIQCMLVGNRIDSFACRNKKAVLSQGNRAIYFYERFFTKDISWDLASCVWLTQIQPSESLGDIKYLRMYMRRNARFSNSGLSITNLIPPTCSAIPISCVTANIPN